MLRKFLFGMGALAAFAGAAQADMVITEWMYSGAGGEFIEFTNVGASPIDMAGWSYDDDSGIAGTVDLSAFGTVDAGESVILTEIDAAVFASEWGLSGVSIIGGNTVNLSRNDVIYLFDDLDAVADVLAYGDQTYAGTIRTQDTSGIPSSPAALGANDVYQWQFAVVADAFGSYASLSGNVGNPGVYVPEPASVALLALGALALRRR